LNSNQLYPTLGNYHPFSGSISVDLSDNGYSSKINNIEDRIKHLHDRFPGKVLVGGYLEKRSFYTKSDLFNNETKNRNIHLGIDIWAPTGTKIYMPEDGIIHSSRFNSNYLDYGATIIIKLTKEINSAEYLLLGHLSKSSIENIILGNPMKKGAQIALLGSEDENGGWPPHLHLQLIRNLQGKKGDYPGLCSEEELPFYSNNCPDPGAIPVI
jgi:murein DD-endopeptidase MepM/ murein hydrolase activator NlpD